MLDLPEKLSEGSLEEHMGTLTMPTVTYDDEEDGIEDIPIIATDSETAESSRKETPSPPTVE